MEKNQSSMNDQVYVVLFIDNIIIGNYLHFEGLYRSEQGYLTRVQLEHGHKSATKILVHP